MQQKAKSRTECNKNALVKKGTENSDIDGSMEKVIAAIYLFIESNINDICTFLLIFLIVLEFSMEKN